MSMGRAMRQSGTLPPVKPSPKGAAVLAGVGGRDQHKSSSARPRDVRFCGGDG